MKKFIYKSVLVIAIVLVSACNSNDPGPLKVLVIAGGHSFDTTEFVDMFRSFQGISFDTIMQPRANQLISEGELGSFDVIVFYDMWPEAGPAVRSGFMDLLEAGTGMVFLHHSLAGYQQWDEFKEVIGGKYHTPASNVDSSMFSNYRHDIKIRLQAKNPDHPVTKNVSEFVIMDEGYGNIEVMDGVTVLLQADHPDCSETAGWTHQYINSRIVYLMQGHDRHAYGNENFRRLLSNAIHYVNDE